MHPLTLVGGCGDQLLAHVPQKPSHKNQMNYGKNEQSILSSQKCCQHPTLPQTSRDLDAWHAFAPLQRPIVFGPRIFAWWWSQVQHKLSIVDIEFVRMFDLCDRIWFSKEKNSLDKMTILKIGCKTIVSHCSTENVRIVIAKVPNSKNVIVLTTMFRTWSVNVE